MPTIKSFIKGYQNYREQVYIPNEQHYRNLAINGQTPKVMLITCCDSRISADSLFNANAGELFIVRNVANLVPRYNEGDIHLSTTAALEFAVKYLGIEDIIVMGHSQCGGIQALMQTIEKNEPCNITSWVSSYEQTRKLVLENSQNKSFDEKCHECEKLAVMQSLDNLVEYPWIKEKMDSGKLRCHAWYYNLADGLLSEIEQPNANLRALGE